MPNIVERNMLNINNKDNQSFKPRYQMNDLNSVFTHYDPDKGYNIPTENKLKGDITNDRKSSK